MVEHTVFTGLRQALLHPLDGLFVGGAVASPSGRGASAAAVDAPLRFGAGAAVRFRLVCLGDLVVIVCPPIASSVTWTVESRFLPG